MTVIKRLYREREPSLFTESSAFCHFQAARRVCSCVHMKDLNSIPEFRSWGILQEQILCQNQDGSYVTVALTIELCIADSNAPAPVTLFPSCSALRGILVINGY